MCLYHLCKTKQESEKGLLNTNKQKTNTRTYVNQRDDMLTKTRCIITLIGAPTTLKSEGEVTSLSGADKREVRDNREKW
jgi:hypothetical protein